MTISIIRLKNDSDFCRNRGQLGKGAGQINAVVTLNKADFQFKYIGQPCYLYIFIRAGKLMLLYNT